MTAKIRELDEATADAQRYWTKRGNELPFDVRRVNVMHEVMLRIQHLRFEKQRLKAAYDKSAREIDAHIANLEHELRTAERP